MTTQAAEKMSVKLSILDRKTGYPVDTQLASITIISDNSLDGEIWTTRLYGEKPRLY